MILSKQELLETSIATAYLLVKTGRWNLDQFYDWVTVNENTKKGESFGEDDNNVNWAY